jgi:hypothetical protein
MAKRENRTPEEDEGAGQRRHAQQPVERDGGKTELRSDDIVPDAVAKRDAASRRREEQMAEGGHLATGIGADRPGGRGNDDGGKE